MKRFVEGEGRMPTPCGYANDRAQPSLIVGCEHFEQTLRTACLGIDLRTKLPHLRF